MMVPGIANILPSLVLGWSVLTMNALLLGVIYSQPLVEGLNCGTLVVVS